MLPRSIRLVMGKKVWDIMGLKSGTPFRFMLRLVKILKLSKTLLKIGMVVHITVGCQSWAELSLSLKFFLPVQHLLTLYTPHIKYIGKLFVFNENVIIKIYYFRSMKRFYWVNFSYNVSQGLICIFIIIVSIFCWFRLVSPRSYVVTLIPTLNKFLKIYDGN